MKEFTLTEDEIYIVKYALNGCRPQHWITQLKVTALLERMNEPQPEGMTNLKELIDEGLIKLTQVRVPVEEAQLVSVSCEDWSCSKDDCLACPNEDPHEIPLSEIPEELREFFDEQTSRRISR
jgi:hypothetical protein